MGLPDVLPETNLCCEGEGGGPSVGPPIEGDRASEGLLFPLAGLPFLLAYWLGSSQSRPPSVWPLSRRATTPEPGRLGSSLVGISAVAEGGGQVAYYRLAAFFVVASLVFCVVSSALQIEVISYLQGI